MNENEDLEFGLIDNDGSFNLLDDEEANTFDNYSDDGMSFESLIGEATTSERADASYSTAELNDLADVINMVENSDEDIELDSVDAKTVDLKDLGLEKIKDEEEVSEPVEITDNTVSLDDLNLSDEDITIDEPFEEGAVEEIPEEVIEEISDDNEVVDEPVEEEIAEEEPVVEEIVEEVSDEVEEEPAAEEAVEEIPEEVVEEVSEEVEEPTPEPIEEAIDITSDLANLEESLNEDDSPLNIEITNLEDEIQVSDDYNIDALFDKASKNAKEASNIFSQNLELRKQIDDKYNKLVKLSEEQEAAKRQALTEIEDYKNEVYLKLKEQKTDVEKKIEELKELQATFEKEKNDFILYRNQEIETINAAKEEIEQQRSAIAIIEEKLVARKNNVDAERANIKAEREQFEIEKKNLKANLKKFNELVGGFTNGIDQVTSQNNEENQ